MFNGTKKFKIFVTKVALNIDNIENIDEKKNELF